MSLHRFAFVNSAFLGSTTITASSQQADLPASNLKSPARGALWRSAIGWNVIAGFNDLIRIAEGAGELDATIAPGLYVLGTEYATAVTAALNAMGGANTYICTYSATTNKFTITRSSGATAFNIFGRGAAAQKAHSALRDLGFYLIDDLGTILIPGTSYTGDFAVNHGQEYVDLDLGAAAIRVPIIKDVNDAIELKFGAGSPLAYVIAPGIYSTPDAVVAAITAATEVGGGVLGSVLTVAWDASTSKFSMTNINASTETFLFGTGPTAVAQTSAHVVLGFASTDVARTTGQTITATTPVYGWNPISVVVAIDHNSGGTGIYRLIASDAAITGAFADTTNANASNLEISGNELQRIGMKASTVARRYLRLVIEDPQSEDGFSDLGILWVGPIIGSAAFEDFNGGWIEGNDPKDFVSETEYGAVVGEVRPAPHVFSAESDTLSNVEKDALQEMQDYAGLVRPILFMRDPLNAQRLISMTWYMRLSSPMVFTAGEGINDPSTVVNPFGATWSVGVSLREIMP